MNGTGNNQDNRAEFVPMDVHAKRQQLLALWKRYREADDYNRPAVRMLLRNVLSSFG